MIERNRTEEKLRRRIKKLERIIDELDLDVFIYKMENRERRERRAEKFKRNYTTDVSAPFSTLFEDILVNDTNEGIKILSRLEQSNPTYTRILETERQDLYYSAYTNGTFVLVNVYGVGLHEGHGIAKRNSVDADTASTGTSIALRRALNDYLLKQLR